MKLISYEVRYLKYYIKYEMYDNEIFYPPTNQKCLCPSLRKSNHLVFASLYLISVKAVLMKTMQMKTPLFLQNIAFCIW